MSPLRAATPLLALLLGCRFGLTEVVPGDSGWEGEYPGSGDSPGADPGLDDEPGAGLPDLTGRVYAIPPGAVEFDDPPGVGPLMGEAIDRDMLLYVSSHTANTITLAGALAGTEGGQDPCERVVWFPPAVLQGSAFAIGPTDWEIVIAGADITFGGFELESTFDATGQRFGGGRMETELDARDVDEALPDGMYACDLVRSAGGSCRACSDGYIGCFTLGGLVREAIRVTDSFDPEPDAGTCP